MFINEKEEMLVNEMVPICTNYSMGKHQYIFIYILKKGSLFQINYFYKINGKILTPNLLNEAFEESCFDTSDENQEKMLDELNQLLMDFISLFSKDKINFDVRIISSEHGITISHNFDLNFKQYMDYLYFQNQWLEEEKYKCALENGEIKSFETELNDIQSDMIDICNEYSLELSDNIFIYINNGESFYSNHGYKIGGKCYKKENIAESGVSDEFDVREYIFDQIEDIFENDFRKLDFLFKHFNRETPKQVLIDYDVMNNKLKTEFKYEASDNPEIEFETFLFNGKQ